MTVGAQSPVVDSPERESATALLAEADSLMGLREFSSAQTAAESAHTFARQLPPTDPNRYLALRKLIRISVYDNNLEGAFGYAGRALEEAYLLDSLGLQAEIHYMKGYVLANMAREDEALKSYEMALRLGEEAGDTARLVKTYINMARIYGEQFDYDMCIEMNRPAIAHAEAIGDSLHLSIAIQNMGEAFKQTGKNDSAIICFERALEINDNPRGAYKNVFPLVNLGKLYADKDDVEGYERNVRKALVIADTVPYDDIKSAAFRHMAEFHAFVNNFDSAKMYGEAANYHAVYSKQPMQKIGAVTTLATIYEQTEDYGLSSCYYKELQNLKEERYLLEKEEYAHELEVKYDLEKKEAENAILMEGQAKLRRQQEYTHLASILLLVVLVGGLVFLIRVNRRRKRFNDELAKKNNEIGEQKIILEQNNEQLKSLNQEKDALMGIVAHDLKAPLAKISGLANVLKIVREDPEEFNRITGLMETVVNSGKKLINELVLLSSLEKSDPVDDMNSVNVDSILYDTLESFRSSAEKKDIELIVSVPDSPTILTTSPKYLGRILDNLLSNAIKFSPFGTQVRLTGYVRGDRYCVNIIDEGPGISPADQKKMFRKFVRLSNLPTGGESSTGLGLSIVKELVEKLGGRIEVESAVGEGATFRICLPITHHASPAEASLEDVSAS